VIFILVFFDHVICITGIGDRSWMYDRNHHEKKGQVKELFKLGVELFICTLKFKHVVINKGGIRCPCVVCDCCYFFVVFFSFPKIKIRV